MIYKKILDWFYPPRCPLCGEVLSEKGKKVHAQCYRTLCWVREPVCKRCGKSLETAACKINELCQDCLRQRHKLSYDQGKALWLYEGVARTSVLDFKYNGMREYVDFYADALVENYGRWIERCRPELFLPIPLHAKKQRMRGFNQAELLAEALTKRLGIPTNSNILYRKRWTEPQKGVSGNERRHNLTQSMAVRELPNGLKCVMLVDDIYTTGSTMAACANVLKKKGVEKVYFLTLCIGRDTD